MAGFADQPVQTANDADLSGRQLGNYQLLRRLGRGAMAEVYLAEQPLLRRRVAVKVLKPALANDKTYLARFEREAQAAASLVHANIVQIHEVGHVDQFHFIAQEYIQGQNLREWIARQGSADLPHALSIMRQVASALAKAAQHGVIHRDIKPENIMITSSGEVKVADFGLARVVREDEAAELTQVGITMGTPLYMSPEQVEGAPLDPRSDIYSLGVTCYHMLTGSPPFTAETALGVAVQHLKTQPKPLEEVRPDLPPALCRMVHKMLAKDRDQRYASAREFLRELHRLYLEHSREDWPEDLAGWESAAGETGMDLLVNTTRQLQTLMEPAAPQRRSLRTRWLVAAVLTAVFLGGGAIAWLTRDLPLLGQRSLEPAQIPRQPSVLRQWYYASQIGTKEAWQSIIDYFPDKKHFTRRAKQQLARICLHELDFDAALRIFSEFAAESETNEELRAFGLAGQCSVLALQNKFSESAAVYDQFLPIRDKLKDAQMEKMLDYVVKKNRSELGSQTDAEWYQWLEEQFRDKS